MLLNKEDGNLGAVLSGGGTANGGQIELYNTLGQITAFLYAEETEGGTLLLSKENATTGVNLRAGTSAADPAVLELNNSTGGVRAQLVGDTKGHLVLADNSGDITAILDATGAGGGFVELKQEDGTPGALLRGGTTTAGDGATLEMRDAGGSAQILIDGDGIAYFNGGNVGIGTTSPSTKLHVAKSSGQGLPGNLQNRGLIINNNAAAMDVADIELIGGSSGGTILSFGDNTDALSGTLIYDNAINTMEFGTNSVERMRINSAGNVGIGTISPQNKLDVEGGAVVGATYSGTNAAPTNGLLVEGNVGIGTAAPSAGAKLDVNGGKVLIQTEAGSGTPISAGEYYNDNSIVAWGRVAAAGALSGELGVGGVVHTPGTGIYVIITNATATSTSTLIPVVQVVAGAGVVKLATVEVTGGNTFVVRIYTTAEALSDNDFTFTVTAR